MGKIFFYAILLTFGIFRSKDGNGQVGWQWAVGSKFYDQYNYSGDGLWSIGAPNIAADRWGNVFLSGVNAYGDSSRFGPFAISNTANNDQMIIAKADSSGNYSGVFYSTFMYHYPIAIQVDFKGNFYYIDQPSLRPVTIGKIPASDFNNSSAPLLFLCTVDGISTDTLGGIYFSGYFNYQYGFGTEVFTSRGADDIVLFKYDTGFHFQWARQIGGESGEETGGFDHFFKHMVATSTGDTYLFGQTYSDTVRFDSAILDNPHWPAITGFLTKYDSSGRFNWARIIDPSLDIWAITTDDWENVYLTGNTNKQLIFNGDTIGANNSANFFILKFSPSGDVVWAKSEMSHSKTRGNSISVDKCGNIWAVGAFSGGDSLIFFNDTLVAQSTSSDPMFVTHFDTGGNYAGAMVFPTGGSGAGINGIVVDNFGSFYLGGQFFETLDFGSYTITCGDSIAMFLAKYKYSNSDCEKLWSAKISTPPKTFQEFRIHPNPAFDCITIEGGDRIGYVAIFNAVGKLIVERNSADWSTSVCLSVANLPAGIYFVKINNIEVRKFIKY